MSLVAATGIPSPSEGVWYLGPLPLRAYGIIIAIGMVVGVWWTARRYVARGGSSDTIYDVALWAIPLGVVGARLYHVVTSPEAYFGPGGDPMLAFQIWRGGLGIWGGVALGALGAYVGVKRAKVRFGPIADSLAPALLVAQGIGRWGNWFNQELYGRPTSVPWGLEIYNRVDDAGKVAPMTGHSTGEVLTVVHPTFLYEMLWNLLICAVLLWVDRRFRMDRGRLFALYVVGYTLGRFWIELMRSDAATLILGLRVNTIVSAVVLLAGVAYLVITRRRGEEDTGVTGDTSTV